MNLEHRVFRRECGSISSEKWYLDDKLHRIDGPAVVYYYSDGSIEAEQWFLYDKLHRLDGPAAILYYPDGSIEAEGWYLDDEELTKEEVEDYKIKLEVQQQIDEWLV